MATKRDRERWKTEYTTKADSKKLIDISNSVGLTEEEKAELPALLARARARGLKEPKERYWMTWPEPTTEEATPIHRAK
jgi:hypothetical protein